MIKKQTKEELIKKIGELEAQNALLTSEKLDIKKEFAKAFDWSIPGEFGYASTKREYKVPSWSEIFTQIGKLLADYKFVRLSGDIELINSRVHELSKKINNPDEVI